MNSGKAGSTYWAPGACVMDVDLKGTRAVVVVFVSVVVSSIFVVVRFRRDLNERKTATSLSLSVKLRH